MTLAAAIFFPVWPVEQTSIFVKAFCI